MGGWTTEFAGRLVLMKLSHINITMPRGGEDSARRFYSDLLGLPEVQKPEPIRTRGGVWFDIGGRDLHISVEEQRTGSDGQRHFGLECSDLESLRAVLQSAGVVVDSGRPVPWKRFFVHDPFGNRIELHEPGAFRG